MRYNLTCCIADLGKLGISTGLVDDGAGELMISAVVLLTCRCVCVCENSGRIVELATF